MEKMRAGSMVNGGHGASSDGVMSDRHTRDDSTSKKTMHDKSYNDGEQNISFVAPSDGWYGDGEGRDDDGHRVGCVANTELSAVATKKDDKEVASGFQPQRQQHQGT